MNKETAIKLVKMDRELSKALDSQVESIFNLIETICKSDQPNHIPIEKSDAFAVRYLTTGNPFCCLLELYILFKDGDYECEYSMAKFNKCAKMGRLYHPKTKKLVKDFGSKTYLRARCSESGLEMWNEENGINEKIH